MNRRLLALVAVLFALPTAATAKKKKDEAAAETTETSKGPETPDDAKSRKFGQRLVELSITDFSPTDAMGATFLYTTMQFRSDNTWLAQAFIEVVDERMECTESGSWKMDPAEADNIAVVTWKLEKTDCGGRDAGTEARARFTIDENGKLDVLFR